ncbi:MAG: hypothetical protein JWO74_3114 [Solirubrobacterales bacterium]|jgi:uncharacterized cupredoxin-like copper-binding protein|nr:hypothetical protein [Solirubrobacterales bacterium]
MAVPFAVAAAALLAAGCGSSSSGASSSSSTAAASAPASSSPGGGYGSAGYGKPKPAASGPAAGQTVKLAADPGGAPRFTKAALSAKAGTVTLALDNPSSAGVQHGIAIEGNGVNQSGPVVAAGSTSAVTAKLKPGTYTFYCPFDGHRAAGMTGTLTVR